ncbi:BV7 family protein [Diolcogaster facetosa bracovirus]|uniref:BV7 family protein n=1 Tax=Bracoviriform facetosae TaxID=2083300 RepID=R9XJE9_9VIRU|nr:BV7 family protein [Diolcogaster facetosa bracovirus] [Bracoviriform facetosae]AGO14484.1 BV7 family protein [Diolcogaster facetosa bracovirus] [Bracoviriform facetosae]
MFVKSTVTLFVLVVGLLSFLSGSASAYPRPAELRIKQGADDNSELRLFEGFFNKKPETYYGAQSYLHQNAIQGSNTEGENYMASAINQSHITVKGVLPETSQTFGPVTIGSYNAIQESNSKTKNFYGSKVVQNDVTYDFRN